jgi:ABC-type branched-subunit amino acid transport system substrate-binding protein
MSIKRTRMRAKSLTTVAIAMALSLSVVVGASATNIALGTDAHKTTLSVGKGPIKFNVFAPFSGPDARFGQHAIPGADVGAYVINSGGGIMGRKVVVTHTDSRGDPADAVPALQQMLATTSNLEAVLGPTSDEALATIPILRREGVPTFDQAGSIQLDGLRSKWVYRILSSDSQDAVAMAYQAVKVDKAKRVALVFASDAGSQSLVAPLKIVLGQMHANVVANISLTPDQPSYSTEVLNLQAAKPDVILTETDDATAATLWSEMYQQSGLTTQIIGSGATTGQDYFQAVQQALGTNTTAFQKVYSGVQFSTLNTCATPTFLKAFHHLYPGQQPVLGHVNYYDSMVLIDFAMNMAHSFDPNKWVPEVRKITNPPAGAVKVCTLAQGLHDLKLGKHITYIGTKDSMFMNKSNTVTVGEEAITFDNTGLPVVINQLPVSALSPYNSGL